MARILVTNVKFLSTNMKLRRRDINYMHLARLHRPLPHALWPEPAGNPFAPSDLAGLPSVYTTICGSYGTIPWLPDLLCEFPADEQCLPFDVLDCSKNLFQLFILLPNNHLCAKFILRPRLSVPRPVPDNSPA